MYDLHQELNRFYDEHVRLGKEREALTEYRDRNLERLGAGLEKLDYPNSYDYRNQGSYAGGVAEPAPYRTSRDR